MGRGKKNNGPFFVHSISKGRMSQVNEANERKKRKTQSSNRRINWSPALIRVSGDRKRAGDQKTTNRFSRGSEQKKRGVLPVGLRHRAKTAPQECQTPGRPVTCIGRRTWEEGRSDDLLHVRN